MQRMHQANYMSAPAERSPPIRESHAPSSPPYKHHHQQQQRATVVMQPPRREAFPLLQLTDDQIHHLRNVEARLLEQYLVRYEDCVFHHGRAIENHQWKQIRQEKGVKVFKRRSVHHGYWTAGEETEPMLMVMGSIEGTLEDVLYGTMWSSRDERCTRAHYTNDGIVDAAVLYAIDMPSSMDPYRSLAIKWSLRRSSKTAMVIKDRDFVFLGATGTLRASTGERVGYELRHSIKIPCFPPIGDGSIVRGEMLSCSFFRQLRGGRVEVFHQASFDAGGDLLSFIAWNHAIDAFIGFSSIIECSFTKKLVRAVKWSSEVEQRHQPPATVSDNDRPWLPEERRCGMCAQPSSTIHRRCAICHLWVCSQCSVRKEIFLALQGRPALARCFCKSCLASVLRDDPTTYAMRELEEMEQRASEAKLDPTTDGLGPLPRPTEPVFFALDPDAGPHQQYQHTRQRQASAPVRRTSVEMPVAPPPVRFSMMAPQDENTPPLNGATSLRRRSLQRSSVRASRAPSDADGEIMLRSDAGDGKWRARAATVLSTSSAAPSSSIAAASVASSTRSSTSETTRLYHLMTPADLQPSPTVRSMSPPPRRPRQYTMPASMKLPPNLQPRSDKTISIFPRQQPPQLHRRHAQTEYASHTSSLDVTPPLSPTVSGISLGSTPPRGSAERSQLTASSQRTSVAMRSARDVNDMLEELVEIAKATSDYTHSTGASIVASTTTAAHPHHRRL